MLYLIFGFIIGILVYLVVKYPDRGIGTKPRPDIKGERGLPIIGNLQLGISATYFLYDTLIKYGPTTTYTIGPTRIITVNNPELLEHVLKTKFDNYVKGPEFSQKVYDVLGNGIFSSDGKMWKFQRKLVSHLFNGKNFRDIICVVFEEETKILLNILQEAVKHDEIIDLQDLFYRFTLDSFGRITLGIDFECLLHPKKPVLFAQKFDFVQHVLDKRFKSPLWPIFELFTEEGAKMRSACDYLSDYAYNIINRRKDDEEALKDPKDILNMFMSADIVGDDEIENTRKLSDKELRDIVLNLIIAGRDTTAQALSWMMYNIIVNPSVEEKLVKEVNSLLVTENPILHYDNIKQFRYTQAVFHETLRLHPSVPKNIKMCIKDDVLPNGTPIYAGEHIAWSSWAMGRDERIWGKGAKKFIPERFLEDEKPNQYKFNSFNCGPRLCLGQTFATVETMTVATAMLKQFKFELLPGQKTPPDFKESLTLPMKGPLLVKVHIR